MTRADKEALLKLYEGCKRWQLRNITLRFVTLTGVTDFRKQFQRLKSVLRRKMGHLEYFGVLTQEGQGVVHFVYVGKSVRYSELSKTWKRISGSWNVSISAVKDLDGLMKEIILQRGRSRYISSRGWLSHTSLQQDFSGNLHKEVYNEVKKRFIS